MQIRNLTDCARSVIQDKCNFTSALEERNTLKALLYEEKFSWFISGSCPLGKAIGYVQQTDSVSNTSIIIDWRKCANLDRSVVKTLRIWVIFSTSATLWIFDLFSSMPISAVFVTFMYVSGLTTKDSPWCHNSAYNRVFCISLCSICRAQIIVMVRTVHWSSLLDIYSSSVYVVTNCVILRLIVTHSVVTVSCVV